MSTETRKLQKKFDGFAIDQLRAEVVKLHQELVDTKTLLASAESRAEYWEENAHSWGDEAMDLQVQLCAAIDGAPAININGQLVVAETRQ